MITKQTFCKNVVPCLSYCMVAFLLLSREKALLLKNLEKDFFSATKVYAQVKTLRRTSESMESETYKIRNPHITVRAFAVSIGSTADSARNEGNTNDNEM